MGFGAPLLLGKAERIKVPQPGAEKAVGDGISALPYIKGPYKKDGERLSTKACIDRTRGSGFKLRVGLDWI